MSELGLDNNWRVLKGVGETYEYFCGLEYVLRREGDDEAADEISKKIRKLEKDKSKLRRQMMNDWTASVPTLREDMRKINGDVRAAVEDIKDDVERTRNIAKVIGYVDDVLGLVEKVLV